MTSLLLQYHTYCWHLLLFDGPEPNSVFIDSVFFKISTPLQLVLCDNVDVFNACTRYPPSPTLLSFVLGSAEFHAFCLLAALSFYSIFKTDMNEPEYLEYITNSKHRQTVAKIRSGKHKLRIESGRHCIVPKVPVALRICQYCSSGEIEKGNHL